MKTTFWKGEPKRLIAFRHNEEIVFRPHVRERAGRVDVDPCNLLIWMGYLQRIIGLDPIPGGRNMPRGCYGFCPEGFIEWYVDHLLGAVTKSHPEINRHRKFSLPREAHY